MSMFDRLAMILHRERMNDNGDCVQILHLLLDAMREPSEGVKQAAGLYGGGKEPISYLWETAIIAIKAGK